MHIRLSHNILNSKAHNLVTGIEEQFDMTLFSAPLSSLSLDDESPSHGVAKSVLECTSDSV